jgi:hypothetical protein
LRCKRSEQDAPRTLPGRIRPVRQKSLTGEWSLRIPSGPCHSGHREDFVPEFYTTYLETIDAGFDSVLERAVEELKGLVQAFRKNSDATLLFHSFAMPLVRHMGILDGHVGIGQGLLIHRLNGKIYDLANAHRGMYILDYEGLVSRFRSIHWYDVGWSLCKSTIPIRYCLG